MPPPDAPAHAAGGDQVEDVEKEYAVSTLPVSSTAEVQKRSVQNEEPAAPRKLFKSNSEAGFINWLAVITNQRLGGLQNVARRFFIGGVEALALLNVWRMLRKSRPLWVTVRNAVLFNAVWMVYGFIHRAIIARRIWRWLGDSSDLELHEWMTSTVLLLFWNLVLYLLLVLLSISWYQDTAQRGCQLVGRRCRSPADALAAWRELLETMGDEVYRLLLVSVFWACAKTVQWSLGAVGWPLLRGLGTVLYALGCSWMAAFYAFEYVWVMIGWTLDERLGFFERRWAYFAGFGAPLTLLTFRLPFFAATAVYASCFPFLILLALTATPKDHRDLNRLPLFGIPHRFADTICRHAASLTHLVSLPNRILRFFAPLPSYVSSPPSAARRNSK